MTENEMYEIEGSNDAATEQPVESELILSEEPAEDAISDDNLFDEGMGEEAAEEAEEPQNIITIRTTGGGPKYIPVNGPTKLVELLLQASLNFTSTPEFYMQGAQIQPGTVVPVGETVTIVGSVKGGSFA